MLLNHLFTSRYECHYFIFILANRDAHLVSADLDTLYVLCNILSRVVIRCVHLKKV